MPNQNVVRTLTVRGISEGMDRLKTDLNDVAAAHGKAATASVQAASVTEESARRQLSASASWDRFRRSVDDAYAAQQKIARADALGQRAVAQGKDVGEVNRVLELYKQKILGVSTANDNVAKSTGLAAYQMTNLRSQMFDVFTSLQGGISPFTVLSQQGPQVYEALAGNSGFSAGLKAAGQSATGLLSRISPMVAGLGGLTLAVSAAAAAYSRFSSNQQSVALGIAGSGRASGATAAGINRVADATAGNGLSAQSVRELSVEFARTGKIGVEMYGDLSRMAKNYAVLAGTDVLSAGKMLAESFADPVRGAEELNRTIGGLDGQTYQLVQRLTAAGDRLGAQRALMNAFSEATKVAAQNVGIFARAWDAVKAATSNAFDEVGKFIARGVEGGADLPERIATAQKILDASRSRASWIPFGLGDSDVRKAQEALDALTKLLEKQKELTEQAVTAQKSLAGAKAFEAMTPSRADILQLEEYRSKLKAALETRTAVPGTEEALKHVTDMLKAGGTEAFNLQKAARDAFAQAPLLSYERSLAQIETKYRDLVVAAHGNQDVIAGLGRAKEIEKAAAGLAALNNPIRDGNLSLNEQAANLKVQRDSFLLSADAAGAMSAKQSLINQYLRDGVTGWEKNSAAIDAYAKRAGDAAAATEKLQRAQQNIVGGMDELRSGTSGMLTGIFSDTRQGKNPLDGIQNALGRMTDQLFERTVSKPLAESLLGFAGKGGGGLFGDTVSKLFGDVSGITTPQAVVNAGTVVVNGGIGGAGGVGRILSSGNGVSISSNDNVAAGSATNADVIEYIRGAAVMRGMDPTTALKVARSEGLNVFDPSKGLAAPGDYRNGTPMSWGPFQLFTGGGLGNVFKKRTGLDPSDPSTWREQVDFSLDEAKKSGWGAWYGAGRVGVGKWDGIGKGADAATESVSKLSDKIAELPTPTDAFTDSLGKVGEKLASVSTEGGGGGLFASIAKWFGGGSTTASANGNIMTEFGPVPLNRYARGGVARSPQFSIFGEGRMPEAYVPLPDGRSIPVTMQSGASVQPGAAAPMQVVINNNHGGANVTAREAPDGNGGRRVEVQIDEMVAGAVGRGRMTTSALRSYGVRQPVLQA